MEQPGQRRQVGDAPPGATPGRAAITRPRRRGRRAPAAAPARPRAGRGCPPSGRAAGSSSSTSASAETRSRSTCCSLASAAARRSAHSRATRSATLRWRVVRPRYRSLNAGSARPRRGPARRSRRRPPHHRHPGSGASPSSSGAPRTRPRARRPRPAWAPRVALARRRRRLQLEAVEPVRGLGRPLAGPRLHRVGGGVQQDRQAHPLVGRELREDVIHRPAPRLADPHAEPRVLLGAQLVDDGAQPVVPAVRAGLAEPELAERQREVVRDDQHLAERHPVPRQELAHRDAGVVHVRLGLGEDQLQALGPQLDRGGRVALAAAAGPPVPVGEPVEHHPADVVARLLVLVARVAQADDELHDAGPDLLNARRTAPGRRPTGLGAMVPRSRRRAARSAPRPPAHRCHGRMAGRVSPAVGGTVTMAAATGERNDERRHAASVHSAGSRGRTGRRDPGAPRAHRPRRRAARTRASPRPSPGAVSQPTASAASPAPPPVRPPSLGPARHQSPRPAPRPA